MQSWKLSIVSSKWENSLNWQQWRAWKTFTIWPRRWHQITPTQKHSSPLHNTQQLSLSLGKYSHFHFHSKKFYYLLAHETSNYSNTKKLQHFEQHTATFTFNGKILPAIFTFIARTCDIKLLQHKNTPIFGTTKTTFMFCGKIQPLLLSLKIVFLSARPEDSK